MPPRAPQGLHGRRVLLVVSGSVAAYKALEAARLLGKAGAAVTGLLTPGGERFVTPHALQAITGRPLARDLWDLGEEGGGRGHIPLARRHDLVLVAPASADRLARMAAGMADDLAGAVLLAASGVPLLLAPAMNPTMWAHPATRANLATLVARGARVVGPGEGPMAEAESGVGRLAEPAEIVEAVAAILSAGRPLSGRRALVTSGPTREALDPVRYLSNHSSGRQGHAIAGALAALGARVTLVSGPVSVPDPPGVGEVVRVESAREMLAACEAALAAGPPPVDVGVFCAAVADWRPAEVAPGKIKKREAEGPPAFPALVPNPDVLATVARHPTRRPRLVVGFAAETERVAEHAAAKRARKGCDWVVANDVSGGDVMGGAENAVLLVTGDGAPEAWPRMPKEAVARRLAERVAAALPAP